MYQKGHKLNDLLMNKSDRNSYYAWVKRNKHKVDTVDLSNADDPLKVVEGIVQDVNKDLKKDK